MTKTIEEIRAELAQLDREHDELLHALEIPEYTDRRLQAQRVTRKSDGAITGTSGWTAGAPAEVLAILNEGDPYILETKGFNSISGWIIDGKWYDRRSDQDLKRQHDAWLVESQRKAKEYTARNREDWARREAALPEWVAARMRAIRAKSGPDFESEPMGWGYELIVCELAVLYAAMGEQILVKDSFTIEDSNEITLFANVNGTSGNQHDFALGLAKRYLGHFASSRKRCPECVQGKHGNCTHVADLEDDDTPIDCACGCVESRTCPSCNDVVPEGWTLDDHLDCNWPEDHKEAGPDAGH